MKIEKLTPGMTVYDAHTYKMGNTTMRTMGVWNVTIKEVDLQKRLVRASWNGNPALWYNERTASKWRKERPMMMKSVCGTQRIATRAERKAATS